MQRAQLKVCDEPLRPKEVMPDTNLSLRRETCWWVRPLVALYLFGIAFVDRVNKGVANGTALSARLRTAASLLALAVAGSLLPPLAFMTLVVVALLALTAFEAVSASP